MSLTMEDFMVHFNNILCHNFGELRGILANQSVKLQKIENMLKELEKPIQPDEESDEDPVVEGNIDPTVNIKKEANLTENLKDLEPLPITSTPKPKRNSKNADLDDELETSPYEIYCCDCKKTFIRGSGEFTRHVKETSCKPYQCHCGKLFKKKSSLNTHKSTHSTESFACHCGAVFKCEQYLKNHQRRKHVEEVDDDLGSLQLAKRPCLVTPSSSGNIVKTDQEPLKDKEDSHFDPIELLKMQLSHEEV